MRARFHAEPIIQATELLLQERIPRDVLVAHPGADEVAAAANVRELVPPMPRRFQSPHQPVPRTHLLSNGRYAVMMTAAGSGYSRWRDLAVTRWREDATCDCWGTYVFLRDARSGEVWSAGYQPTGVEPDSYEATFFEDRAEIVRRDGAIETTTGGRGLARGRRRGSSRLDLQSRNRGAGDRADLVCRGRAGARCGRRRTPGLLQSVRADGVRRRHRRPSGDAAARGRPPTAQLWAAHLAVVEGEVVGAPQFETDRARFLGRGRGIRTPIAVIDGQPLSNTPAPCSIRSSVFAAASGLRRAPRRTIAFWTLVASSRSEALDLADKHHDPAAFERAVTLAWTQAQVQLYHLGIDSDEANLFQRLASHVLYSNPALRPSSAVLERSEGGPSALWAHGISGDLPIVLVRIADVEDLQIVRQLLHAHEYWRMKQLAVDLVILNEHPASYAQDLQTALETMVRTSQSRPPSGKGSARGAVFILRADLVSPQTRSAAPERRRAVLWSRRGSLFEQVKRLEESATAVAPPPRRRPATANAGRSLRRCRSSSSSTVSAASQRTAANT